AFEPIQFRFVMVYCMLVDHSKCSLHGALPYLDLASCFPMRLDQHSKTMRWFERCAHSAPERQITRHVLHTVCCRALGGRCPVLPESLHVPKLEGSVSKEEMVPFILPVQRHSG